MRLASLVGKLFLVCLVLNLTLAVVGPDTSFASSPTPSKSSTIKGTTTIKVQIPGTTRKTGKIGPNVSVDDIICSADVATNANISAYTLRYGAAVSCNRPAPKITMSYIVQIYTQYGWGNLWADSDTGFGGSPTAYYSPSNDAYQHDITHGNAVRLQSYLNICNEVGVCDGAYTFSPASGSWYYPY